MRGTKRIILPHGTKYEAEASLHNKFEIEVVDTKTGEIRQKACAFNVICNTLFTALFNSSDTYKPYFNAIVYGSGSGTPAVTDTALFKQEGCLTNISDQDKYMVDLANCSYSRTRKAVIIETESVGVSITEIGIQCGLGLCTHAMLQDMNGNLISIAKTNTDIINIYATVYVTWPSTLKDSGIWLTPGAMDYSHPENVIANSDCFFRTLCGGFDSYNDVAGFLSSCGLGSSAKLLQSRSDNFDGIGLTYTNDVSTRKLTFKARIPADSKYNRINGSLRRIMFWDMSSGYGTYPRRCDLVLAAEVGNSWYPGADIVGEAIGTGDGTTTDFKTIFEEPSNATVYVDGVAVQATVDALPTQKTKMGMYFDHIVVVNGQPYIHPDLMDNNTTDPQNVGHGVYQYRYPNVPLTSAYLHSILSVEGSNDLSSWTVVFGDVDPTKTNSIEGTYTIPNGMQNFKYWRIRMYSVGYVRFSASSLSEKNIHFSAPPASGAVITADYHTPVIAKDANHVFDISLEITLSGA